MTGADKSGPGKLKNDCFALPPGVDWTPVDEALQRLRDSLSVVADTTTVPVADAGGRILAAPATAQRSNPPCANAAVDGYGFTHATLPAGDEVRLPVVEGRAAAGAPYSGTVPGGSALRILTGAPLPPGVDTVVLEEDTELDDGAVRFGAGLKPGANCRAAGEDVPEGQPVLSAGQRIRPQDIALLTALGVDTVRVHRPLRVGVLSTGDELVRSGATPAPHQIHDANRPMLIEMLRQWQMEPVDLGQAADDAGDVRARLDRGAGMADAILTTGGASAGDEDHISAALRAADALTTWRIAVKPGRPLALGVWSGAPVFGLPGNPVAAFVCALIFARPALGLLAGQGWRTPLGTLRPAAFSKRKKPGRREYLRARLNGDGAVEVFKSEGSGRISGLSWADGLAELPDGALDVEPGTPVRYFPFSDFGL